jgi:hypothetical protein
MAMDDDLPRSWPSRLHGAWQALAGQSGSAGVVPRAPASSGRVTEHPHALLIESLIAGLPGRRSRSIRMVALSPSMKPRACWRRRCAAASRR